MKLTSKTVDIPSQDFQIILDKSVLKKLRRIKFLSNEQYLFLAIRASYPREKINLKVEDFCEEWGIAPEEFDWWIAKLIKKGWLGKPSETVVQLELFMSMGPEPEEMEDE